MFTKKTNQSGRSMVEMIAVLAIMGILSLGALSGTNYIKNKNVANKIQKEVLTQASELKTRHRLGADIDAETGGEVPYHYESEFVASRFYTPGTKTLAIRANASRDVCEMLKLNPSDLFACVSTTSVTSCGNITTECAEQNTMTFVIDDLSSIPGGGSVDLCENITCPNNNYTCIAGACVCKSGYFGKDCTDECPIPKEGCHKETATDSNGCTTFRKTSCNQDGQACNMTDGTCYCAKGECNNTGKCLTTETMYDANGNKIENTTSTSSGYCCSSSQEWVPGAGTDGEGRCKDFCPTENGAGRDATTHECLCAAGYQLSADGKKCEQACKSGYCLNLTSSPCMDSSKYVMFDENGNEIEDPDPSSSGYCCEAGKVLIDGHCCPPNYEWVESVQVCKPRCPPPERHGAGRNPTTGNCMCEAVENGIYEFDGSECVLRCTMDCYNLNTTTRTCERHYNTEYCCSNHTDGRSTNLWDNNSQRCSECTKSQEICRSGSRTWCCPPGQCGNQVGVCCSGTLCCPKNQQPFCANGSYSSGCLEERCCTGNLDLADPEKGVYLCCASGSTPYCSSYSKENGVYVCKATACCAGGVRKRADGRDYCCNSSGQTPYCSYSYYNKTTGQCSNYSCCSSGYKVLTMQEGFEHCISSSSYTPYCYSYNSDGSCSRYRDCYTPSSDPNRIKKVNDMDVCCNSSTYEPYCKDSSCSSRDCCSGTVISTSGGGQACCSGTSGSSYCSSYDKSDPSKCTAYACCSGSSVVKKLGNLETCCSSTTTPYCEYYNSKGECYDLGCCSGGRTYCDSYTENTSTGALTCSQHSCCSSSNTLTTHKGIDICHGSLWKPQCQYSTKDGSKCRTVYKYCDKSSTITSFGVVEACCSSTQKPYCYSYNSNGTCSYASCCSGTLVLGLDGRSTCQTTSDDEEYTDYAGNTKTCPWYNYVRSITGLSGRSVCCSSSSDTVGYCSQYDTSGTCTAAACCSNDKMVACYEYSLSGKCLKKGCCVGGNIYCNAVDESGKCLEEACCVGTTYCADGSTDCATKKCCKTGKTIKCTNEDETTGNCIENSCS